MVKYIWIIMFSCRSYVNKELQVYYCWATVTGYHNSDTVKYGKTIYFQLLTVMSHRDAMNCHMLLGS